MQSTDQPLTTAYQQIIAFKNRTYQQPLTDRQVKLLRNIDHEVIDLLIQQP